jgi:hypothetical protein
VQNATLRIAVEMGLAQTLAEKKGEPMTAAQLSKQTGASQVLIGMQSLHQYTDLN